MNENKAGNADSAYSDRAAADEPRKQPKEEADSVRQRQSSEAPYLGSLAASCSAAENRSGYSSGIQAPHADEQHHNDISR